MEIDNGSNNNYVIIRSNPNVNGTSTVEAGTGGLRFLTTLDSPIYTQNYTMCMFASYTTGTPISSSTPTPSSTVPPIPVYQPIRRIQSFSNGTLIVSTLIFDNSTGQLTGNYASNQTTETLTNTPLQGDVLIAALGLLPGNISSITERGVTWTRQVSQYSVGWSMDAEIWLGRVSQNADPTITFNLAGPQQTQSYIFSLDVCEYSGVATTLSLDQNATNVGFTAFSDTGQTPMTTQPNELWVGAVLFYNSVPQTSPTNNFLIVGGQPNATGGRMSTALLERIVNQTGTANSGTSATYNGQPDPSSWLGCIATFFAEKQAPNPLLRTIVTAMTENGSTISLAMSGNITSSQMSNITIATNQSATTTTLSFTVNGESGTIGFGNITIPKIEVPNSTTPTIYIDGQAASNQGYTQDANNYYVWYTTHFSIHQISIIFAPTSSSGTIAQSSLIQVVYGVAIAATVVAMVVVGLVLIIRGKNKR